MIWMALPADALFVSKREIAQARRRVGSSPLKALFELSAHAWCAQDRKHYLYKRLSLFALDGMTLKIADTPELREDFVAQVYPSGRVQAIRRYAV